MDLYEVLGVERDATTAQIKKAYRELVKTLHPDAGGGTEEFLALQQAYDILSDKEKRARYDIDGMIDNRVNTVDSDALNELIRAFNEVIQMAIGAGNEPATIPILAAMVGAVQLRRREHENKRRNAENTAAKIEAVARRMKMKKRKVNHLKTFAMRQAQEVREQALLEEHRVKVMDRTIELIKDYDFEHLETLLRLSPDSGITTSGPNPNVRFR